MTSKRILAKITALHVVTFLEALIALILAVFSAATGGVDLGSSVVPYVDFLYLSRLFDYGYSVILSVLVLGAWRGDELKAARILVAIVGVLLGWGVAATRQFGGIETAAFIKSVITAVMETTLGLTFAVELILRLCRPAGFHFHKMAFSNFLLTLVSFLSFGAFFAIRFGGKSGQPFFPHGSLVSPVEDPFEVMAAEFDTTEAKFVQAGTASSCLVNLVLIVGSYCGDSYKFANPLFALLGSVLYFTIGGMYAKDFFNDRFMDREVLHRVSRQGVLNSVLNFLCGISHLLAVIMFVVMREEETVTSQQQHTIPLQVEDEALNAQLLQSDDPMSMSL